MVLPPFCVEMSFLRKTIGMPEALVFMEAPLSMMEDEEESLWFTLVINVVLFLDTVIVLLSSTRTASL
jgi:hypothetical protein